MARIATDTTSVARVTRRGKKISILENDLRIDCASAKVKSRAECGISIFVSAVGLFGT